MWRLSYKAVHRGSEATGPGGAQVVDGGGAGISASIEWGPKAELLSGDSRRMLTDLSGRPERRFETEKLKRFFAGKRALITGAAGSIGSALAERLAELGCGQLGLLDHFDHGLLDLYERIRRAAPAQKVSDILCDIRDRGRLDAVMRAVRPDVVLHAAALKHVHLGERHPIECVLTNLVGMHNAMAAAANAGASHFILVSSDKAAAPVCIMGGTKRLAELHVAGFAAETAMQLKSVRFGNVLGSQGSVLPRFAAQIGAGGPLEVTHPEMERYFMTPAEAVGLILSVAAFEDERAGCAYMMEMGEPVSILAIGKEMIRRSGKRIEIAITGLRPGERVKESLFDDCETIERCAMDGVFRMSPKSAGMLVNSADVAQLEAMVRGFDDPVVRQRLFAYVDERLGRDERAAG